MVRRLSGPLELDVETLYPYRWRHYIHGNTLHLIPRNSVKIWDCKQMNEHFKPSLFPSANNPLASVTDVCRPLEDAGRTSVLLVWAVLGVGFRDWPHWVN